MRWKVCGLRRKEDVEAAVEAGADFLGFIFYRQSPRFVELEKWESICQKGYRDRAVYVSVAPPVEELAEALRMGFHHFQIHLPESRGAVDYVKAFRGLPGGGEAGLWIAPKFFPREKLAASLLNQVDGVLMDGQKEGLYGGTGVSADWSAFRQARRLHPEHQWILAGGLHPDNALAAWKKTEADILDFNSGVESSPGEKNPLALRKLSEVMKELKARVQGSHRGD